MKLKSAVKIAAIRAAYTQSKVTTKSSIGLTAGIFQAKPLNFRVSTLNRILADAEEGNFIYFAKYFDTFYVKDGARPSDEMVFELFRYLADSAEMADAYVAAFNKIVGDGVGFSDTEEFTKDFNRPVADTAVLLDAHAAHVGKPLTDSFFSADDAAALHPNKHAFDTVGSSDQINTFAVGKALADTPVFLEAHRYDMGKPLTDTFAALEAHSLEPGKVLTDVVSGIGDYVFIFAKKAPDDTFAATDQINTFAVGKPLADNAAASDAIYTFGFGKSLDDAPAALDEITSFGTSKQLTDAVFATDDVDGTASILDDQEMQFVKQTTDVVGFSDELLIYKTYIRDFLDAMAAQDAAVRGVGKTLSGTSLVSESINMLTGKQIYDIPVASETVSFALARLRSDSALLGDAAAVAAGKVLLDSASIADAGSLLSQGFTSDPNYFAGDYVGTSRAF